MVSKEDVEELVEKLCSDKAKARKEAVKELHSYLEGSGGGAFIAFLDQESASLHDRSIRIPAASWPGLLQALCQCIYTEVLAAKKRPPESILAKTFKLYIQKAEESKREGGKLFLWRKALMLFQHIDKVLQDTPNFVMDYATILRQLLQVREYRYVDHITSK
jgi:ataxia telangiectasia mutated family protein